MAPPERATISKRILRGRRPRHQFGDLCRIYDLLLRVWLRTRALVTDDSGHVDV